MNSAAQSMADPAGDLALVRRAVRAARADASAVWFPLLLSGCVTLASPTAVALIGGADAPARFWAVAGPAIGAGCALFYAGRRVRPGRPVTAGAVLVAVALAAGALALGLLAGGDARTVLPWLAVTAGFGAFAVIYRSLLVAVVAAAQAAGAGWLWVDASARAQSWHALLVGAAACAAALVAMTTSERSRPVVG